jgi:formylmethanofuran dehydrogenase subunit D
MHVPWSGAGHYALFMRQAIEPVGECRNDLDICADLAQRLGVEGYNDKTEEVWLREFCAGTEIGDFEAFREQGLARLPAPDDAVAFAREVRDPQRHPFSTPSGKIEVYSTSIAANPDMYGLGAIAVVPTYIHPYDDDPRHPLLMVTPKSRARTHSIHDNQEILARADRQDVWLHPDDAAARGIADGAKVRVFNQRGATIVPVRVTDRIVRGVVSLREGAWFTADAEGRDTRGCANVLTADRSAPSGASTYNTGQVEVEPAPCPGALSASASVSRPVGTFLSAVSLSTRMSAGSRSTRSAMIIFRISSVPPPIRRPGEYSSASWKAAARMGVSRGSRMAPTMSIKSAANEAPCESADMVRREGVSETLAAHVPVGQPLAPPRCRSPVRPRARWRERGQKASSKSGPRPSPTASRSFDAANHLVLPEDVPGARGRGALASAPDRAGPAGRRRARSS